MTILVLNTVSKRHWVEGSNHHSLDTQRKGTGKLMGQYFFIILWIEQGLSHLSPAINQLSQQVMSSSCICFLSLSLNRPDFSSIPIPSRNCSV